MIEVVARPIRADALSTIEEVIEDARNGKIVILVDDTGPDHDGDFVLPAQLVTPQAINFMATHGRGIVCLAMTEQRANELGLPPMNPEAGALSDGKLRFTTSIEARTGVTTGISAADRARTIAVAVDASNGADALVTPGHVFPLVARPGGVLMRSGRTEGAVDIARLAGLTPSSVICRILCDDGRVARFDDLWAIAESHGIRIAAIRDLVAYRHRHDHLAERVAERHFATERATDWRLIAYRNRVDGTRYDVLVKGDVAAGSATLVGLHRLSLMDDIIGARGPGRRRLQRAMAAIEDEGRGVIVLLPSLAGAPDGGMTPVRAWIAPDASALDAGASAQILADLGVDAVIALGGEARDVASISCSGFAILAERSIPV